MWNGVMSFGGQYTEAIAATIIKQVLQALVYLHSRGIPHRNIRTGNILFSEDKKLNIKLVDFDIAGTKVMEATKMYDAAGGHGPYYCAPEIFKNETNEKCDVWSVGVTLYFILYGRLPFDSWDFKEAIK